MPDDNSGSPREVVIGTAGHIDHGKTLLVRALTGIDTDRFAEEKRRGISIDLGFAHLELSNGRLISFIDVPGHERFIKNMLAGVGGIQAVVLIVAADESVKPQTREHFDICRLLGIRHGIIVLTKSDLASPKQIRAAREDVRSMCAGSFLDDAPAIAVSAVSGAGLDDLKRELAWLAERVPLRDSKGLARLPIDRSFALKGFGTIVTGTLWSGKLRTGATVQLHPSNQEARIRGLQIHGTAVDAVAAGQRSAVNLTGIDHSEIRRGFVLTEKSGLETTKVLDVSIDWLHAAAIPQLRQQFLFHAGTAEIPAMLKILSNLTSTRTLARIRLSEPVLALPEDRFILRRPSPAQTVAGGFVIDAFPPTRLNRARTVARLQSLAEADLQKRIEILIRESAAGRRISDLLRMTGQPRAEIHAAVTRNSALVIEPSGERVVASSWVQQRRQKLVAWLTDYHAKNPSAAGAPISAARMGLEPPLANLVFDSAPGIRVQGDVVSLSTHKPQRSSVETQALSRIELAFRQAGFQPPPLNEVLPSAGVDTSTARALLEALIKSQKLVRVSETLIFHAEVIAHIRKLLSVHKGRRFSVPEFKDWTQVSRKYAIPLLEYFDHQHVTRREGDARVVL